MPTRTDTGEGPMPLRRRAEELLKGGASPPAKLATTGAEALTLLHRMASTPDSASAALKLLHELQVQQVELDLQLEQLEQVRDDLTRDLGVHVERFHLAPIALLVIERDGRITDANLATSNLTGFDRDTLRGRSIDSLVTPQGRSTILLSLKRLCDGGPMERCAVDIARREGTPLPAQMVASVSAGNGSLLLALIEGSDHGSSRRTS